MVIVTAALGRHLLWEEEDMAMGERRVLLETPMGFALLSAAEDIIKKPNDVWIHFRDAKAAQCIYTLGYAKKIKDKGSAEGKTFPSKKLVRLLIEFCMDGKELYVESMDLEKKINELGIGVKCCSNYTLVGEIFWGLKNVVHEFAPQEKDNITKEYCLPLGNGLQKFLNEYCINLPPSLVNKDLISKVGFLAYLDISVEEVCHKLREYDVFVENIGQGIKNNLSYAKVLASILVPEVAPKYDFSKMFPKEFVQNIEKVRSSPSVAWYHKKRFTMNNRKEIIGGLAHFLTASHHMDKLITHVKAMETQLLEKLQLELELEFELENNLV